MFRPSQRALKAAENSSSTPASTGAQLGVKRKARDNDSELEPRITRKIIISLDDDDGSASEGAPPTEPDEDYESIKAMADADNQVCLLVSSLHSWINFTFQAATFVPRAARTADVQLIFRRDKAYIHPVTGQSLDGHVCLICQ